MNINQKGQKAMENYYRRWAKRLGVKIRKSRAKKKSVWNQGWWQIVDEDSKVQAGEKFDLSMQDVDMYLETAQTDLQKPFMHAINSRRLAKLKASENRLMGGKPHKQ
jgi:hypothetical protein